MTNTKKAILTIGTMVAIAAPVITVVSCGDTKEAKKELESAASVTAPTQQKTKVSESAVVKNLNEEVNKLIKDLAKTSKALNDALKNQKSELVKQIAAVSKNQSIDKAAIQKSLADQKAEINRSIESLKTKNKILKDELELIKTKQVDERRKALENEKNDSLIKAKTAEIKELETHTLDAAGKNKLKALKNDLDVLILKRFPTANKTSEAEKTLLAEKLKKALATIETLKKLEAKRLQDIQDKADAKVKAKKTKDVADQTQIVNLGKFVTAMKKAPVVSAASMGETNAVIVAKITDRASFKAVLGIDLTAIQGSNFAFHATEANGTITVEVTMTTINATAPVSKPITVTVKHAPTKGTAVQPKGSKTPAGSKTSTTSKTTTSKATTGSKTSTQPVVTPKSKTTKVAVKTSTTSTPAKHNPATPAYNIYK